MPLEDEDKKFITDAIGTAIGSDAFTKRVGEIVISKAGEFKVSEEKLAEAVGKVLDAKGIKAPDDKDGKDGDGKDTRTGDDGQTYTAEQIAELVQEKVGEALKAQADDASKTAAEQAANKKATAAWLKARGLDKKIIGTPLEKRFDGCADDDARQAALDGLNEDLTAAGAATLEAKENKPANPFVPGGDGDDDDKKTAHQKISAGIGDLMPGGNKDKDAA